MKTTITMDEFIDLEPCKEGLKFATEVFHYTNNKHKFLVETIIEQITQKEPAKATEWIQWLKNKGYGVEKQTVKKTIYRPIAKEKEHIGYVTGRVWFDNKDDANTYYKAVTLFHRIIGWETKKIEVEE